MTTPTELRPLAHNVILAGSALLPFTHGSGRDSHGYPVPKADRVISDALRRLAQAGRDAQALLDRMGAEWSPGVGTLRPGESVGGSAKGQNALASKHPVNRLTSKGADL